jgi:two-component system, chemotaxis family, chemotaxis protein CheY
MTKKFLVADDSRVSRTRLRGYIEDMGHEVVGEAVDGLDAIAKFGQLSPDFVTMDIEMPNLNGIDAAKQILQLYPDANITLITSVVDKKITLAALRFGVRSILQKPVEFEEFREEINNQIGAIQ